MCATAVAVSALVMLSSTFEAVVGVVGEPDDAWVERCGVTVEGGVDVIWVTAAAGGV